MWTIEKKRKRTTVADGERKKKEPAVKKTKVKKPKSKSTAVQERKRLSVTDYVHMKRQEYVRELQKKQEHLLQELAVLNDHLPKLTARFQYREKLDSLERKTEILDELDNIQYGYYLKKFDELVAPYYDRVQFIELEPREVIKTTIIKVHPKNANVNPTIQGSNGGETKVLGRSSVNDSVKTVVLQDEAVDGELQMRQLQQELQCVLQENNNNVFPTQKLVKDSREQHGLNQGVTRVHMSNCDMCLTCRIPMVIMGAGAIMGCTKCKQTHTFIQATSSRIAYGEEVEFTSFSYRRENHFQEWLNCFQGKESTKVDQDIVDAVQAKCAELGLTDPKRIQIFHVREALKLLGLSKYYENQQQITTRISEETPPTMTPHQEEQVRNMFSAIIPFFEKHKPANRRNFLSYAYCLYKFCELMGWDQFLKCFSLLKGRDKLKKQDMIFKLICEDLDWEFIPSVEEEDLSSQFIAFC